MSSDFVIAPACHEDLTAIMRLERLGFAAEIVESETVFRARLDTFPDGFLVLRESAGGNARGYICMERWASDPGADRAAYVLGHDPALRYSPTGTVLYIASMTIDPALRGLKLGAGFFRESRARVLRQASEIRLELLLLHGSWQSARRIYASEGFQVRSVIPDFFPALPTDGPDGRRTVNGAGDAATLMERQAPMAAS